MNKQKLAKDWHCSITEVEDIAKFMNERFYLWIGEKNGLFYGEMTEKITYEDGSVSIRRAMSTSEGYKTPREAANVINTICDRVMPKLRAELLGVPVDAYRTLKKVVVPKVVASRKKTRSITNGRGARA